MIIVLWQRWQNRKAPGRDKDAACRTDRADSDTQALLADEQAMMKKLRDRSIELDIESFAAQLDDAMER
jgi:hypothetical protein